MKNLFTLLTALLLTATAIVNGQVEITDGSQLTKSATFSVGGTALAANGEVVRGSLVEYSLTIEGAEAGDKVQVWQLGTTANPVGWVNQSPTVHTLTAGNSTVTGSFSVSTTGDVCLGTMRVAEQTSSTTATKWDYSAATDLAVNFVATPSEVVDTVGYIVTDKHDGEASPTGGEYAQGDTITFSVQYEATLGSALTVMFKDGSNSDMFTTDVVALPAKTPAGISQFEVIIPADAVTGDCQVVVWPGAYGDGTSRRYEYITITAGATPVEGAAGAEAAMVYPNPSTGVVTFTEAASVYSLSGVLVKEVEAGATTLSAGAYIVKAGAQSTKLIVE